MQKWAETSDSTGERWELSEVEKKTTWVNCRLWAFCVVWMTKDGGQGCCFFYSNRLRLQAYLQVEFDSIDRSAILGDNKSHFQTQLWGVCENFNHWEPRWLETQLSSALFVIDLWKVVLLCLLLPGNAHKKCTAHPGANPPLICVGSPQGRRQPDIPSCSSLYAIPRGIY